MDARCSSRILAQGWNHRNGPAAGASLGSLTTAFKIERLTLSVSPANSGDSTPRSSPSGSLANGKPWDSCFGQQRQHLENAQNLDQVVSVSLSRFASVPANSCAFDRVLTVVRAFVFRMGEDAAEHGFDVLQRGLRQIAVVRNSAKHFARVHGSETAQWIWPTRSDR